MRFLEKSKQYLQKRFMKEYIRALEEKQQQSEGNTVKNGSWVGPNRQTKQIANDQIRNIVEQGFKDD